MGKLAINLGLVSICVSIALSGCGGSGAGTNASKSSSEPTSAATTEEVLPPGGPDPEALISVRRVPGLGPVLVDSGNKTLYRFSKDIPDSGKTHCYGACVRLWYPKGSYRPPAAGSPQLDPSKFGTILREEGYRQATYYGWPLYTLITEYSRKKKGAGKKSFGGTWYALRANGESVK
jgi:predicted lipoprotein with Yx(FWY)xxD motif